MNVMSKLMPDPKRRRTAVPLALLTGAALAAACSSGPPPDTSGIPGFEPTVNTVSVGTNDRMFVIDSNDVVVISRDMSLLGGIYLLLDDAQLTYRRYLQKLPPRTAVGLTIQPADSMLMDSIVRAAKAPVTVYEHVEVPRDNSGNPLPIARFLVSSVRNKVARAWITGADTAVGSQPLPDWVVAGTMQLITGFPSASARSAQLASQLDDLIPIDSLTRMTIPESAVPAGVSSQGALSMSNNGRFDSRSRAAQSQPTRKVPPQALAALEAGSLVEFMWAREGRGIVKQLVDASRRGSPLSSVIAQAVSLPHDVAGLEAAWKASLTPPPKKK